MKTTNVKSNKQRKEGLAQQLRLFKQPSHKKAHGGSLAVQKRRSKRPLNINQSHHLTMKSYHAVGSRSLFRHKKMILSLIKKNSIRFKVKVFEYAIQGNHVHMLVKAESRIGLQNFFRVVAGHIAQRILKECPLKDSREHQLKSPSYEAGGAPKVSRATSAQDRTGKSAGCKKNQRKFWSYLLYSRMVTWGREFKAVVSYIQKNTLELLQIIAYQPRVTARHSVNSG